jgi:mRNA interferase ChpB
MKRGDIYLVSLDPSLGQEQKGTRPVVIVSQDAFNRVTKLPVVLPITTVGSFSRGAGFAVNLMGVGIETTGIVRCDQPRVIDLTTRKAKKLESLPEHIMDEILAKLIPIFD